MPYILDQIKIYHFDFFSLSVSSVSPPRVQTIMDFMRSNRTRGQCYRVWKIEVNEKGSSQQRNSDEKNRHRKHHRNSSVKPSYKYVYSQKLTKCVWVGFLEWKMCCCWHTVDWLWVLDHEKKMLLEPEKEFFFHRSKATQSEVRSLTSNQPKILSLHNFVHRHVVSKFREDAAMHAMLPAHQSKCVRAGWKKIWN